jgi:hypothetical protein
MRQMYNKFARDRSTRDRSRNLTLLIAFFLSLVSMRLASAVNPAEIFSDVTKAAGITWKQFSGESPDRFMIEAASGGVAFLDYDGDGLLDIFLVNGGETPKGKSSEPVRNALYHNLGNGKFEDVAAKAGVDRLPFYGMGVAAADYDNDGHQDLYITGTPRAALFHNNGDGTFTEIKESHTNRAGWGWGVAFFDMDNDTKLDIYAANGWISNTPNTDL